MIKISIITVVLNSASTIRQTITSVLSQKNENVEYIIIDGGSTDGTRKIIDEYTHIVDKVIYEPDNGIYDAMNKGIKVSDGDIIGIINADDRYREGTLQNVVNVFNRTSADVICGEAQRFDGNGYGKCYGVDNELLWLRMSVAHPATFVSKKAYMKYGVFDTRYRLAADYELLLRMYTNNAIFEMIPGVLTDFQSGGISDRSAISTEVEAFQISLKYSSDFNRDLIAAFHEKVLLEMLLKEKDYRAEKALRDYFGIRDINNSYVSGLCVYGAGYYGRLVAGYLVGIGFKGFTWVDRDDNKWTVFDGVPVYSPEIIGSRGEYIIIAIDGETDDIKDFIKRKYMKRNLMALSDWGHYIANNLGVYK